MKLLAELDGLKVLRLCECRNVTDDSVTKIAEGCLNLIDLDLRYTKITDASVWAFYNNIEKKTVQLKLFLLARNISLERSRWNHPMLKLEVRDGNR